MALVLLAAVGAVGVGIGRHSGFGHHGHRGHLGHQGGGHSAMERGMRGGPGMGPDRESGGPGTDGPRHGLANTTMLAGAMVSVGNGNLVVAPDGGAAQVTVPTTDRTRMLGAGNGLAGLQPGQRVVVRVG
ncbi:MAG: hypothetical protein H0V92_12485, partial [Pseudonocardiales bacterium]|nr:hypothetical protein [Pseudonocardiales bacterium]